MIRILAIAAAVALIGYPLVMIYRVTVPVAECRTGSYHDFIAFAIALLIIYGGVLLGVTVYWARVGRTWQRLGPVKTFTAGFLGAMVGFIIYIAQDLVRGLITHEKAVGIFWPVVLIFVISFGALVSGGMAFLLYGLRPSGEGNGLKVGSIGQGTNSDRDS